MALKDYAIIFKGRQTVSDLEKRYIKTVFIIIIILLLYLTKWILIQ